MIYNPEFNENINNNVIKDMFNSLSWFVTGGPSYHYSGLTHLTYTYVRDVILL